MPPNRCVTILHSLDQHATRAVAAALMVLLPLGRAQADTGASAEPQHRFTGPLVSGAPPLPRGMLNIEPYLLYSRARGVFDGNGRSRAAPEAPDQWLVVVPVQYGLSPRLTVGGTFTAVQARADGGGSRLATGDTSVSASWLLAQSRRTRPASLTLVVRHVLPTGRHDRLEGSPLAQATGAGARATWLGLYGQAYFREGALRGRFNVLWRPPGSRVSVQGESAYGSAMGFYGQVRPGEAATASVALEYSLSPRWAVASDLVFERVNGWQLHGAGPEGAAATVVSPASWRLSLAPAVEYHPSDRVGLIFGAQVSLAGRHTTDLFVPQLAINLLH
jgi:hypothetical protein